MSKLKQPSATEIKLFEMIKDNGLAGILNVGTSRIEGWNITPKKEHQTMLLVASGLMTVTHEKSTMPVELNDPFAAFIDAPKTEYVDNIYHITDLGIMANEAYNEYIERPQHTRAVRAALRKFAKYMHDNNLSLPVDEWDVASIDIGNDSVQIEANGKVTYKEVRDYCDTIVLI